MSVSLHLKIPIVIPVSRDLVAGGEALTLRGLREREGLQAFMLSEVLLSQRTKRTCVQVIQILDFGHAYG